MKYRGAMQGEGISRAQVFYCVALASISIYPSGDSHRCYETIGLPEFQEN